MAKNKLHGNGKIVKVQILLEGEDAALYEMITHKKQFITTALKLFAGDEKLRLAFFKGEPIINAAVPITAGPTTQIETTPPAPIETPKTHRKEW